MTLSLKTLLGLLISAVLYVYIAWRIRRRSNQLDDHLPLSRGDRQARVRTAREFSAATVATTISLATVILAYAELAGSMGLWLLWTVITTALGILVVRLVAPMIWRRLALSGDYRPTLHEFLGQAFGSRRVTTIAALCTSLGFISALAVELTVGSRFLASLAPIVPSWMAIALISAVGVGYTMLGGFRVVVVTDRIQMWAIWGSIAALLTLIGLEIASSGGIMFVIEKMPRSIYDFSWRDGLTAFLVGIAVINIPTFLADMSIWQRIAASKNEGVVRKGLGSSVFLAAVSWAAFAAITCLLVILVTAREGENPLLTYLRSVGSEPGLALACLFVVTIAGLYGASLSTASTQLIAAGHTLHIDILRMTRDRSAISHSADEIATSQWLLLMSAGISIAVVEGLRYAGFSIADLVFAVYGAQLGLVPAVLLALFAPKERLPLIQGYASLAISFGFLTGWSSAGYGKWTSDDNLIFLSPAVSLIVSSAILGIGLLADRLRKGA